MPEEDPIPPPPSDDDGGDEKPNIARIIALAVLLIGLSGYLYYVRIVNPPSEHEYYATLPGIDVRGLSDAQMQSLLQITNNTQCGCGLNNCTMTLAECRHKDPGCHTSLAKINLMVANLRAGKPITDSLDKVRVVVPAMPHGPPNPGLAAPGSAAPAVSGSPGTLTSPASSPMLENSHQPSAVVSSSPQ